MTKGQLNSDTRKAALRWVSELLRVSNEKNNGDAPIGMSLWSSADPKPLEWSALLGVSHHHKEEHSEGTERPLPLPHS